MKLKPIFHGSTLKWIAVVTMFIDHFGVVVLLAWMSSLAAAQAVAQYENVKIAYWICRSIGRIAFPIYCFLLVEGFTHTKNVGKYLRNLAIFALVSEIPFDYANHRVWLEFTSQNVFFTLFLGLLAIMAMKKAEEQFATNRLLLYLSTLGIVLIGFLAGQVLHTDYGGIGVLVICIFYARRNQRVIAAILAIVVLTLMSVIEAVAVISILCIALYDGTRGRQIKYFFYAFYPGHLVLLCIVRGVLFFLN